MTGPSCPRCGAEFSPDATPAGLCPACLLAAVLSNDSDSSDAGASSIPPGTQIGPFRILGLLGRGGMAAVYRAQDTRLDRTIALKVLPPEFLHDGTFARRFEQEARVVAKLEHRNIVPIYASGIDDGIPWMSMRLLAGGTLGALLKNSRPETGEAVRMLRSIADALDYAHALGIVHRDIKPTNILLDGFGGVCIGDFGLAQMLDGDPALTRTGTLIGTPHYMAPEQALGEPANHRCDIYSLGIVAYEIFVGATPFTADSPVSVLLKHVNQPLPVPSDSLVSRPMVDAIQKAVAKSPSMRWRTAGEFVSRLEAVMGMASGSPEGRQRDSADRHSVRTGLVWTGAAIGAVSVAAGLTWWMWEGRSVPAVSAPPVAVAAWEYWPIPSFLLSPPITHEETIVGLDTDGTSPAQELSPREVAATPASPVDIAPQPETISTAALDPILQAPGTTEPSPPVTAAQTPIEPVNPPVSPPAVAAPRVPDVVTPPVRTRTVSPDYPAVARAAQLEGDVMLRAVVGPDGQVGDVTVLRSVHPLLDAAARTAVLRYEYTPGQRNGVPEAVTVPITVSFRLR